MNHNDTIQILITCFVFISFSIIANKKFSLPCILLYYKKLKEIANFLRIILLLARFLLLYLYMQKESFSSMKLLFNEECKSMNASILHGGIL
jgi:hypothetical protein